DPLRNPLGKPAVPRRTDNSPPLGYPIGLAYRRKLLVKASLIIVNDRLTMGRAPQGKDSAHVSAPGEILSGHLATGIRPTEAQRRYLERGLTQAGGKLPLFDRDGREVSKKTIESCVAHGWGTPRGHHPQPGRSGRRADPRARLPAGGRGAPLPPPGRRAALAANTRRGRGYVEPGPRRHRGWGRR